MSVGAACESTDVRVGACESADVSVGAACESTDVRV